MNFSERVIEHALHSCAGKTVEKISMGPGPRTITIVFTDKTGFVVEAGFSPGSGYLALLIGDLPSEG